VDLLFAAGTALTLMGFVTDPIRRIEPRSLHGLIHDAAYVIFVLAFLATLFSLWWRFEADPRWRAHARYTLATGTVAVLLLLLPGVAYYLFIVTLLIWIEVSAILLWRSH
jgi:hypothetical protein